MTEAFGDSDINTIYSTGSVTKMFTATAVMQLYEQDLLDLDEDINLYLPIEIYHPEHPSKQITVRNLLSHQSGLNGLTIIQEANYHDETIINWLSSKHGWPIQEISPQLQLTEYLKEALTPGGQFYLEENWLDAEPGTVHQYSNTNYYLLVAIIEQVTGQTYIEFMQENIFDPLDMSSSGYDYTVFPERYALGYEREFRLFSKTNLKVPYYSKSPGPGGLISTVADLSKFMVVQLNEGRLGDAQILSPDSVEVMHEKGVDGGGHINKVGYGLGFTHLSSSPWQFYDHFYGMNGAIGHEGGNLGYSAALYFIKEGSGGYGFILLSNVSTIEDGVDFTWYFPIYYKLNVLLMEEAANMYGQTHSTQ
jgi:CubicO group peptidase (beta-lactamase class C family)